MRIVVLQATGGVQPSGVSGGGSFHAVALANEWLGLGADVTFVTNEGDHAKLKDGKPVSWVLPATFGSRERLDWHIFVEGLLNHWIQRESVESLIETLRASGAPTVVIATNPFLSDIVAANRIAIGIGGSAVVYFHHLAPSPLWFPSRRGSLIRTVPIWLVSQLELFAAKLRSCDISLDQPRSLTGTGWRFRPPPFRDDDFLPESSCVPEIGQVARELEACFVGRVVPNKGVLDAIRAWSLVVANRPGARLRIVGKVSDTRFEAQLRRTIAALGLEDNVSIAGYLPKDQKVQMLRTSKLFLFPSYEEGWSLSVMEAVHEGAAPVIYDLPAYDYLGPHLEKVKPGSEAGLARCALRYLSDERLRTEYVLLLRESARRYTARAVALSQLHTLEAIAGVAPV